ncbi:MAG: DUF1579 domain-containing protein [Alphaproteobacteria bacterium]|nr:DUF1579 domain-containing protein [Alphaproteobacteria bacterium]MCB9975566.1 DUF1579 domain-containing protein [Rhodospirillales bacterium]
MNKFFATALMAGCLAFSMPALAEDAAAEAVPSAAETAPAGPDAEAMAKMMELMQPGEMHKKLETLAGSWSYTSSMQMTADAPVEESSGTSENTMVFGGRFLKMAVKGTMKMNGQDVPFEGEALTGYDNVAQQFQNVWYDSFATSMMTGTGTFDEATQTIKEVAEASCPMTGGKRSFRNETKFIDADHFSYTMHSADPKSGVEYKMMEIQYTRVK